MLCFVLFCSEGSKVFEDLVEFRQMEVPKYLIRVRPSNVDVLLLLLQLLLLRIVVIGLRSRCAAAIFCYCFLLAAMRQLL